jgi:hypothetical protein
MPRINLSGGSYQARSAAVAAQRCLNLYSELLPAEQGEPTRYAHYLTPGLRTLVTLGGEVRCLYTSSQGDLLAVAGSTLFLITADGGATRIGGISSSSGQVRMQDNALVLFVVDGSDYGGWYCNLPTSTNPDYGALVPLNDSAFYGSQTIAILDTFLLFTQPRSTHWYTSPASFTDEATTPFLALYVASKTSYPDEVVAIASVGQTIWVFGQQTTELWYDSGAADFPFARIPSVMADQGCGAAYSVAVTSGQVFWLGRDRSGHARVYSGVANQAQVVSTFAVDQALNSYGDLSDSFGWTYQQDGHQFYLLTVPSAGKTWVFDASTSQWHERCSLDSSGNEARYRANCWAAAYGKVWCGDYLNGRIYEATPDTADEAGMPVKRQRAFPHLLADGKRAIHRSFMLDMQTGQGGAVDVDYSDDRGQTFSDLVTLSLGSVGSTYPTRWRLGMARDRVYRVTWTGSFQTALMGAFLEMQAVRS